MAPFLFSFLFPYFLFFLASEQLEFRLPSAQILTLSYHCPSPTHPHCPHDPFPPPWAHQCLLQAGAHMELLPSVPSLSLSLSSPSTPVSPFSLRLGRRMASCGPRSLFTQAASGHLLQAWGSHTACCCPHCGDNSTGPPNPPFPLLSAAAS